MISYVRKWAMLGNFKWLHEITNRTVQVNSYHFVSVEKTWHNISPSHVIKYIEYR